MKKLTEEFEFRESKYKGIIKKSGLFAQHKKQMIEKERTGSMSMKNVAPNGNKVDQGTSCEPIEEENEIESQIQEIKYQYEK